MNKVCVIGRLTDAPAVKDTKSGKVANASIAVPKITDYKSADFFRITAFNNTAGILGEFGHKGDKIAIEGHLSTSKYEAKDGTKRECVEIIVDRMDLIEPKKKEV